MLSVLESWQFFSEKPIGLTRNLRRSFDYSIIKTTTELLIGKKHKVQAWSRVESSLSLRFEFRAKLGTFFMHLDLEALSRCNVNVDHMKVSLSRFFGENWKFPYSYFTIGKLNFYDDSNHFSHRVICSFFVP